MFCKHNWEMLSEKTTKSKIELAKELGVSLSKGTYSGLDRKFIQVITCRKCGKLKRFVEKI